MLFLEQLFSEDLLYALGWTVIHSLWQAVVIAIAMALVLLGMQKRSAHALFKSFWHSEPVIHEEGFKLLDL